MKPPETDAPTQRLLARFHARRARPLAVAALRKLLAAHGYPAHPSVLAFERAFGGLELPEADAPRDWKKKGEPAWIFGAGACLASGAHRDPRGGARQKRLALVPVAYSPDDVICYLDAAGRGWGHDTIESEAAALWAPDGRALVSGILAAHEDEEDRAPVRAAKPAKPAKPAVPAALGEPEGFSFCLSTTVRKATPERLYADWLDPAFHKRLRGAAIAIDPRVGGAMRLFGAEPGITIKRLVDAACIELEVKSKALKKPARVEIRFEALSRVASKLMIYFWGIPDASCAAWSAEWSAAYTRSMFNAYLR